MLYIKWIAFFPFGSAHHLPRASLPNPIPFSAFISSFDHLPPHACSFVNGGSLVVYINALQPLWVG